MKNEPLVPYQQLDLGRDPLMEEALRLTTGERHHGYGPAEEVFEAYAMIWTGLLLHKLAPHEEITAADVALLMAGLKLGRESRNPKADNVVDAHGYLSILTRLRKWWVR